jgi:8-oxo-dGTP pyrophosphatase MutT (NUDIX family)
VPRQKTTDQAVIAAIAAVDSTVPLLFLIRQPDRPDPAWKFVGGAVEVGETIEQALVREVAEETGGFTIPYNGETLGNELIVVEKLFERPVTLGSGTHQQHCFLVLCQADDILYLDGRTIKENAVETIETKIFSLDRVLSMPDFLPAQRFLLEKVVKRLRVRAA